MPSPFFTVYIHFSSFVSNQFQIKWVKIVSKEWRIRCADTKFSAERLGEQLWRYPFPYGSSCWMEHSQQPSPMGLSCLDSNLYNPLWEEWYVFLENIPFPFPSRRHTVRRWLNAATGGRKTNRMELKGPRIGHKLFSFSPPWTLLQPAPPLWMRLWHEEQIPALLHRSWWWCRILPPEKSAGTRLDEGVEGREGEQTPWFSGESCWKWLLGASRKPGIRRNGVKIYLLLDNHV